MLAGATKWVWFLDGDREPKRCYQAFPLVGLGQEHIILPLQTQTEAVPNWGKGGAGNVQPKVKVSYDAKPGVSQLFGEVGTYDNLSLHKAGGAW